jgi:hypothetical protein
MSMVVAFALALATLSCVSAAPTKPTVGNTWETQVVLGLNTTNAAGTHDLHLTGLYGFAEDRSVQILTLVQSGQTVKETQLFRGDLNKFCMKIESSAYNSWCVLFFFFFLGSPGFCRASIAWFVLTLCFLSLSPLLPLSSFGSFCVFVCFFRLPFSCSPPATPEQKTQQLLFL